MMRFGLVGGKRWQGKHFILGMIAAAGLLGGWALVRASADSRSRTIRLADGRKFTLRAVTFGTEHRYVHGQPWAKALLPLLPLRWQSRFGLVVLRHKTEGSTIMFWGSWRGGSRLPPFPPTVDDASVSDLHGSESEPVRFQVSAYPGGSETVLGWNFANFPRRQERIGLRLYHRDNDYRPHFAGECQVGNPAVREYPFWTGSAPPTTRTNGDWEFTLVDFATRERIPERVKPTRGYIATWTRGAFQVAQKGKPSELWQLAAVEVRDATGNYLQHAFLPSLSPTNQAWFGFNSVLWPGEEGWRLGVEFTRAGEFSPADLWTVPAVPIPGPNLSSTSERYRKLHGVMIEGLELSWLPAGAWMNADRMRSGRLNIRMTPPARGVRLHLIRVVDDRGKQIRFEPAYINPIGIYGFKVMIPTNSEALDFTFAVQQSEILEFLARPSEGY